MSRGPAESARGRAAVRGAVPVVLGILLALALTHLVPALVTTDTGLSATAGIAVALATLVALGLRSLLLAAAAQVATALIVDASPLLLSGRVTDPVHHPLRPRAPGQA